MNNSTDIQAISVWEDEKTRPFLLACIKVNKLEGTSPLSTFDKGTSLYTKELHNTFDAYWSFFRYLNNVHVQLNCDRKYS